MRAAVLHQYDEKLSNREWLVYENVPDPVIENDNDVIVRIGGAGVCRTDLYMIEGMWRKYFNVAFPHILGHENAGWVEDIGKNVSCFEVGDPVIIHPQGIDNSCDACKHVQRTPAPKNLFPGMGSKGGYAEFMAASEKALVRLPSSIAPMDAAPLADAGLTAYHVAKKASRHLLPGESVVIIGAGGLGHIGIQALKALSAVEIIVTDISHAALDLAKQIGADFTVRTGHDDVQKILALTDGHGAHTVIDFVANDDTIEKGFAMTRRTGYYYIVGYGGKLKIPTLDIVMSEKTIVGNRAGSLSDLAELIGLTQRRHITLTTKEYPLSCANEALHDLNEGKITGRAVLIP